MNTEQGRITHILEKARECSIQENLAKARAYIGNNNYSVAQTNNIKEIPLEKQITEPITQNKEGELNKLDINKLDIINDEIINDDVNDTTLDVKNEIEDDNIDLELDIEDLDEKIDDPDENIKEVDIDINSGNNLETFTLKKPNQVYFDLYKEARNKAKLAKKQAIIAYLEAKNIKKTYMIDNLDDSESDFDAEIDEVSESELEGL